MNQNNCFLFSNLLILNNLFIFQKHSSKRCIYFSYYPLSKKNASTNNFFWGYQRYIFFFFIFNSEDNHLRLFVRMIPEICFLFVYFRETPALKKAMDFKEGNTKRTKPKRNQSMGDSQSDTLTNGLYQNTFISSSHQKTLSGMSFNNQSK